MNVLYVGSGNSAHLVNVIDLNKYTICCVNNAWRLFEDKSIHAWIHSGDFPKEQFPTKKNWNKEVNYTEYSKSSKLAKQYFKWDVKSPAHHLGYTIFFLGLYWIMMTLRPNKISLLGFDHDYNPNKLKKWKDAGRPNIQNRHQNKSEKTIKQWGEKFFKGYQPDSFYGVHSTPDPMRLKLDTLTSKFKFAEKNAIKLGIDLGNLSPVVSDINTLKKHHETAL